MKKYFFTGLVILLPIALTCLLFVYLIDLFTDPFISTTKQILGENIPFLPSKYLPIAARLIILVGLFFFIFFLGLVARWFFIHSLLQATHKILYRIPFVKTIYKVLREVANAFFSGQARTAFKHPTMTTFPSKRSHCLGFVTGTVPQECLEKTQNSLVPVFIPTAPHPISGYLVFVPEKDAVKVSLTNEDVVKFTVSCGVILPGEKI